jgi:small subunit ribosomal protein S10
MIKIIIKSINLESLLIYKEFLKKLLQKTNNKFSSINLPIKKKKITLLKSPHVNKKSKEQFQIKTYKFIIIIKENISLQKIKFLLINKPKTIKISIKK